MQQKIERDTYLRSLFEFDLPAHLIAQNPAPKRDESRLLIANGDDEVIHGQFSQLPNYLRAGDVLVLNQTKVMRARCFAKKETGGKVEIFFLGVPAQGAAWTAMVRPLKKVKQGMRLVFPNSQIEVVIGKMLGSGLVELHGLSLQRFTEVQERDGQIPLPPYIKRAQGPSSDDECRYQTVFARDLGAVAAPTAGLHFTAQTLSDLEALGVQLVTITHHVGIGTFKPLEANDIRDHIMEEEHYEMSEVAAQSLNRAREQGRRIVAVGTTSTRCLESNIAAGQFKAGQYSTKLFIYPGYKFQAIHGLVTNFHLPGSSLILLVCALMGRVKMMSIYQEAIVKQYRFYSYGDAMLLLPPEKSEENSCT